MDYYNTLVISTGFLQIIWVDESISKVLLFLIKVLKLLQSSNSLNMNTCFDQVPKHHQELTSEGQRL